ncbi:MAG: M12 family metallopeptidase [Chitinophagaceae bacterium]|jgi:hypothetical protein|nr:M12 family metallopeptidase [Chitinophagaceae bacterium]
MKRKYPYLLLAVIGLLSIQSINAQVKVKNKLKTPKLINFCSTIQPVSKDFPFDTTNARAMAENYFLWDNGKTITVKFIGEGGSPRLREKIKVAAKEWEKYANISFNFVESGDANIRILVTDRGGCNSVVGTVALFKDSNEKTMNLDSNFFYNRGLFFDVLLTSTVQHEFGHAIGLLHEHSYKGKILWNKEVVYKDAEKIGWTKKDVDFQIFEQYESFYTNGFAYDPLSIMHYGFNSNWTLNNVEIKSNFKISEIDKQSVALLYPKNAQRINEFPRFVVSNYTQSKIIKSSERKGLLIYPSFNLTTAGRNGKLYLVAYLYDADGKAVPTQEDPTKNVIKYIGLNFPPGIKMDINKLGKKDYEIFLPYADIPSSLKDYIIAVRVILIDDVNNQVKHLAQDVVPSSQIK